MPTTREGTPVHDHVEEWGLWVKREDLSALPPGPAFSKTRGVYPHIKARPEQVIGVLDTYHSQAGHAVAHACAELGRHCINFYPEYKHEPGYRAPQERAKALGAELVGLPAGRSSVLYHQARRGLEELAAGLSTSAYLMPNALKLPETVTETAHEVWRTGELWGTLDPLGGEPAPILLPASSATIAAGVILGVLQYEGRYNICENTRRRKFLIHMGYERSQEQILQYVLGKLTPEAICEGGAGLEDGYLFEVVDRIELINEFYGYKDKSRGIKAGLPIPSWPCNPYYDLKAFHWWLEVGRARYGRALLWNVG